MKKSEVIDHIIFAGVPSGSRSIRVDIPVEQGANFPDGFTPQIEIGGREGVLVSRMTGVFRRVIEGALAQVSEDEDLSRRQLFDLRDFIDLYYDKVEMGMLEKGIMPRLESEKAQKMDAVNELLCLTE